VPGGKRQSDEEKPRSDHKTSQTERQSIVEAAAGLRLESAPLERCVNTTT
jgi:hypothetical protein